MMDPVLWWASEWALIHVLWIGAVVGLAAMVVRTVAWRAAPRWRYASAVLTLTVLGLAPLAAFAGMLELADRAESTPPVATAPAEPTVAVEAPVAAQPVGPVVATPATLPAEPWWPWREWLDAVASWLPVLWAVGAALGFLWFGIGWCVARRWVARARELDPGSDLPVAVAARRAERILGISRSPRYALSDDVRSPMVVGTWTPTVLVPSQVARECDEDELEMILLHELAHVRRRDNLANAGQRAIECTLFFHPVTWWLSRWARLERERCCDAEVVRHTGEPQRYVRTLLALSAPPGLATRGGVAMSHSPLVDRVRTLLQQESMTVNVSRRISLPTLGALALSVAIVTTRAQTPPRCPAAQPAVTPATPATPPSAPAAPAARRLPGVAAAPAPTGAPAPAADPFDQSTLPAGHPAVIPHPPSAPEFPGHPPIAQAPVAMSPTDCRKCHVADPHPEIPMRFVADESGLPARVDCSSCHVVATAPQPERRLPAALPDPVRVPRDVRAVPPVPPGQPRVVVMGQNSPPGAAPLASVPGSDGPSVGGPPARAPGQAGTSAGGGDGPWAPVRPATGVAPLTPGPAGPAAGGGAGSWRPGGAAVPGADVDQRIRELEAMLKDVQKELESLRQQRRGKIVQLTPSTLDR